MAQFTEISPAQLMRLLGTPEAPQILDVCIDPDFAEDPRLIPTSQRIPHGQIADHAARLCGAHVVVVCQKGRKLSQGAAALLRARGVHAEALSGGIHAWRDAALPLTPAAALPASLRWVTRHRPKIDRIACPWLLRRFVAPKADILFVPPADVALVAEKFEATAFDCDSAPFAHKGAACTFDALLDHFALHSPALDRLAQVVRAADTGRHDVPQAAGLLALSVGLSRQYKDDHAQLAAALPLYDALYRWARDGADETHASAPEQAS